MLSDLHCYRNRRPDVDWNTCGQAAIATMADFWELDPWGLPRTTAGLDGRPHWSDGAAIDAVAADGFGPDVVFALGTTGGTVRDALRKYGLNTPTVTWSGVFSAGWQDRWQELRAHLDQGRPVPVLVDCGALGGDWYTAHWAIAGACDDTHIGLGAMGGIGSERPTHQEFLHAWHCAFLPVGFNHCGVYTHP